MEERGNPLNEEELKMISKCTIMFEVAENEEHREDQEDKFGEQATFIKGKIGIENEKCNKERSQKKARKTKKAAKESKDAKFATSEPIVRGPKDIKVNYRGEHISHSYLNHHYITFYEIYLSKST